MNLNELNELRDSILAEIKKMMLTTGQVTQYIGARYVPKFANPIEWDDQREYEPLTIVQYQGDSYTSRQFVPKGIRIADAHYWALTGNYNAQVEQYRQEVKAFDARIEANTTGLQAESNRAATAEAMLRESVTALETRINTFANANILWVGDSIANGQGVEGGKNNSYCAFVTKYLNANYYNAAVNDAGFLEGTTLKQQLQKFHDDNPDIRIDYLMFMAPLNDSKYIADNIQSYYNAIRDFIAKANELYPNALIYSFNLLYNTNPFQNNKNLANSKNNSFAITRQAFNTASTLGYNNSIYHHMPYAIFDLNSNLPNAYMQADGIHYTLEGQKVIANTIMKALGNGLNNRVSFYKLYDLNAANDVVGYSVYDDLGNIIKPEALYINFAIKTYTPNGVGFNIYMAVSSSTKKISKIRIWHPYLVELITKANETEVGRCPESEMKDGTSTGVVKLALVKLIKNTYGQLVNANFAALNGNNVPICLEVANVYAANQNGNAGFAFTFSL